MGLAFGQDQLVTYLIQDYLRRIMLHVHYKRHCGGFSAAWFGVVVVVCIY